MILTNENYFSKEAELHYMGSTQYKRFKECEVMAMAILNGEYKPETSTSMLVGSYVDAHFSGTLNVFKTNNPEIFKRDGMLKADYEYANYIIARIEREPLFMEALSGESQVILTGEIEGVPVKIKVDSLLPDRTVDLKIMKDLAEVYSREDGCWNPFWRAWGYDTQAAIYQHVRAQNDAQGVKKPFGLAVATKEKPEPDIALIEIPQREIDAALGEIGSSITYYNVLKKGMLEPVGCGTCPVCRSRKVLKGWAVAC